MITPRARMIAGPNGSGKSTLFDFLQTQSFPLGYCLNPDKLEDELARLGRLDFGQWGLQVDESQLREFLAAHPLAARQPLPTVAVHDNVLSGFANPGGGYFAAMLCDFLRRQWIATGQTFTFETVMSSADKVALMGTAHAAGFRTYLYYVCTDSLRINRERVAGRVLSGGHDVPADKIDARYQRSLELLPRAIRASDRAYLFDNSSQKHRLIAEYEAVRLKQIAKDLPGWFVQSVLSQNDLEQLSVC